MRSLSIGWVVALTLTATATADMTYTITGPGGVSSYAPGPGETFRVSIDITNDDPSVVMVAYDFFMDDGGAGYTAAASSPWLLPDYIENYADAYDVPPFDAPRNTSGWNVLAGLLVEWDAGPLNDVRVGTMADDLDVGATSGFAVYIDVTAPAGGGGVPSTQIGMDHVGGTV